MGLKKGIKKAPISGTGERNGVCAGDELTSFVRTGARKPLAYRRSFALLSLVVKPALACSLPYSMMYGERNGAGDGKLKVKFLKLLNKHCFLALFLLCFF